MPVRRLIYPIPQRTSYSDSSNALKIPTADGEILTAVGFRNSRARQTILYSHGNEEDIAELVPFLKRYRARGFNVLAYDYRGYGSSTGTPSEAGTYHDIDAAFRYLRTELKVPARSIIAHGRSLGAAVTIDLASRSRLGGIIVESAFETIFAAGTGIRLPYFDWYNNSEKIGRIRAPKLFIHGTNDDVIAIAQAMRVYQRAREPKFSWSVHGAGHNDVDQIGGRTY